VLTSEEQIALVGRAKQGDASAMEALVRAYLRASYAVALAILRRPSDAEDVAQDAFILAFERIDTCREEARFGGWLLQIVRNQAKNRISWRKLRDVAEEPSQTAVPTGIFPEIAAIRRDLIAALGAVTAVQREVVLLHDLEGWTHPEIGETLGISAVMSRQHLFLARRRIRAALESRKEEMEVINERAAD
jgi:RNA polymerase sigma-70 factor (ECF subfamily)